MIQLTHIPTL